LRRNVNTSRDFRAELNRRLVLLDGLLTVVELLVEDWIDYLLSLKTLTDLWVNRMKLVLDRNLYVPSSVELCLDACNKYPTNETRHGAGQPRHPQAHPLIIQPPSSTSSAVAIFAMLTERHILRNFAVEARSFCDVRTFSEETFDLPKRFLCDFDGRCNI
jgi:hypothetical protein